MARWPFFWGIISLFSEGKSLCKNFLGLVQFFFIHRTWIRKRLFEFFPLAPLTRFFLSAAVLAISFPESSFPLTSGRKMGDSGSNHFEITREITKFCTSGFTAQSASIALA